MYRIVILLLMLCGAAHGATTRFPLVLAHGFNAGPDSIGGFNPNLIAALRADGYRVYVTQVSPLTGVATRAIQLRPQIDAALRDAGTDKVNIIAHSMGGLDARFLISRLGYAGRVASLSTISTPHHGSPIADDILDSTALVSSVILNNFARAVGATYTDRALAENSDLRAALSDLSTANAAAFALQNPNQPGVYYQSWAGLSNVAGISGPHDEQECLKDGGALLLNNAGGRDWMDPLLTPLAWFVARGPLLHPNDGVVAVASARWGRFRGCIPADHLDQIGQIDDLGPDEDSGFDYVAFYRQLAAELAAMGY